MSLRFQFTICLRVVVLVNVTVNYLAFVVHFAPYLFTVTKSPFICCTTKWISSLNILNNLLWGILVHKVEKLKTEIEAAEAQLILSIVCQVAEKPLNENITLKLSLGNSSGAIIAILHLPLYGSMFALLYERP